MPLMKKPSWQPSCHDIDNNSPRGNDPEFAIVSPEGLWFLAYPWGFCQGTRDWRGRVSALNHTPCTPPAQCELAAKWGTKYIESKRCSFPVAEEFSINGGDTPLDQLTVKKLIYLISVRHRKPPSCVKKWPLALGHISPNIQLDWKRISSIYTTTFLSSKDFHLHYKHILHLHRAIITRHTYTQQTTAPFADYAEGPSKELTILENMPRHSQHLL
eukprot:scaffold7688_cov130-Isochrysis_galbana.AAC.12